jgi:F0F1-type ATP synthase assembly protein I
MRRYARLLWQRILLVGLVVVGVGAGFLTMTWATASPWATTLAIAWRR